ncbi:MAG: hypothetical protein WBG71_10890 [Leeuwenhoekiella sp.]
MKSVILVTFLSLSTVVFSQNFKELSKTGFETEASYTEAHTQVLQAANYLFENPADKAEADRLYALGYIINWMQGTPDYTFSISDEATKLTKGNQDIFGLYWAAMTKAVLENPDKKMSDDEVHEKATDILVAYCANPENNMKPSRKIKKLIKARKG